MKIKYVTGLYIILLGVKTVFASDQSTVNFFDEIFNTPPPLPQVADQDFTLTREEITTLLNYDEEAEVEIFGVKAQIFHHIPLEIYEEYKDKLCRDEEYYLFSEPVTVKCIKGDKDNTFFTACHYKSFRNESGQWFSLVTLVYINDYKYSKQEFINFFTDKDAFNRE